MSEDQKSRGGEIVTSRQRALVENVQPLFDTAKFEHMQRAATALMNSTLLPPSVRGGSPAECFSNLILVFEMADRFKMPGTSLAQCVSIVHGKMMLEGKVITAMLESTLAVRLNYYWTGDRGTPAYRIYVWDKSFNPTDGDITQVQLDALAPDRYPPGARMIDGSVADWQTTDKNGKVNPSWTGAAQRNQLAYRGSREWARLYEAGAMLGVYGDDEVTAWEDARVVRTDAAPAAISTGFTRPAAEPAADAEFTDVSEAGPNASTTTKEPQEAAGQAEASAAADAPAAQDMAATERLAAALTPAEPKTAPRKPAAPKPAAPAVDAPKEEPATAEAGDTQHHRGLALEAFEAGHKAGLGDESGDLPHAWSNFPEEYAEGWNAGAAERMEDANDDGDDAGGDDEETFAGDDGAADDPTRDRDDFDTFLEGAAECPTWADVKRALTGLSRSDAWKAAIDPSGLTRVRQSRITAGLRLAELQAQGKEALDIQATDLTAFRCWMETVDDADMVQGKWNELVQSPAFQALDGVQRGKMEGAVRTRMESLRQPGLGV